MGFKRTCLLLLIYPCLILCEEPWGSDATLANPKQVKEASTPAFIPRVLIRFHQRVLSPTDGPRSHFTPSSSAFAYEAIAKHGVIKGSLMAFDRLMRENSEEWVYPHVPNQTRFLKWDPVPAPE